MDTNEFQLIKFSALDPAKIALFNTQIYHKPKPEKFDDIAWKFRIGFDQHVEPIYLIYQDEIVGQAGLCPVLLNKNGSQQIAIWFNNFIVSPTLQGKGLGKLLTEKWMSLAPIHITNCNDNSMAVFKKLGWKEEFSTARFGLPLNIYTTAKNKKWKGVKLLTTKISNLFYQLYLKAKYASALSIVAKPLVEFNIADVMNLFPQDMTNCILKDKNWFHWRFFTGPFAHQYQLVKEQDAAIIIRVFQLDGMKRLHIVYQTTEALQNKKLVESLIKYALKQKIDLMWALTNVSTLKTIYATTLSHTLETRFAFHANVADISNEIAAQPIPLQAADSDYDYMYA